MIALKDACAANTALQIIESLRPVLRHITHLTMNFLGFDPFPCPTPPWPSIFCQASTTHTLTHLVTDEALTDVLVSVLVQHAPALSHLTVDVSYVKTDHSGSEWGLTELCPTSTSAAELVLLPTNRGVMDVRPEVRRLPLGDASDRVSECRSHTCVCLGGCSGQHLSPVYIMWEVVLVHGWNGVRQSCAGYVTLLGCAVALVHLCCMARSQGLAPHILRRLPSWRFHTNEVYITASSALSSTAHPAALQCTLQQLHDSLQTGDTDMVLRLAGWQWSDVSVVQTVAAALPSLPQYRVSLQGHTVLTDGSIGVLVAMGDRVHSLSVDSISLQSYQHANAPWRGWDRLSVSKLDTSQLLRLPRPPSNGPKPHLTIARSLHLANDLTQVCVCVCVCVYVPR